MNASTVCRVFESCFVPDYNIRLCGGADEPLYEPVTDSHPAVIWFRDDYVASALHEVAHWCIAGTRRRQLTDYGYWYTVERSPADQRQFEGVEARPQALEWIFCQAAAIPFRVSCDNFDPDALQLDDFRQSVRQAALGWLSQGLPSRAARFARRLSEVSTACDPLQPALYRELPQ